MGDGSVLVTIGSLNVASRRCDLQGKSGHADPRLAARLRVVQTRRVSNRILVSIDAGIADVRLNRPDKLNAVDPGMFTALAETGASIGADQHVRVVVLSGEGRGFCSGLDLSSFQAMAGAGDDHGDQHVDDGFAAAATSLTDRLPGKATNLFQEAVHVWANLDVPVIAACHGPVLGAGFQLALGADIRYTTPDAKWSILEIRWGLLPDMTGIQQLIRLVALDVAKELTYTGRMMSGTEAAELGVATHVVDDPHGAAMSLAAQIASKNPHAIRGMKSLLNAAGTRPLVESLTEESRLMASLLGSPNQVEAVMAYFEKRPAVYVDP